MRSDGDPTILVVNPGSTSTKVAVFRGRRRAWERTMEYGPRGLKKFRRVADQIPYRAGHIREELRRRGMALRDVDVFAARGGLLRPVEGGVYRVNGKMLRDLLECRYGEHASNLGAVLAWEMAKEAGGARQVYIANPVVVDELDAVSRVSGHPAMPRRSVFHALNQKAVAEKAAAKMGRAYRGCRLIVAHVGGGISVGVHRGGRVVDVNNALEGEGPFTPERTGGLALLPFLEYVQAEGLTVDEARRLVTRGGGLLAHLETNDCRRVVAMMKRGSRKAREVFEALAYQLARAIAAGSVALRGRVDAVVLTGNAMKCGWLRTRVRRLVDFVGPVVMMPGNFEMEALARAALEVYRGGMKAKEY